MPRVVLTVCQNGSPHELHFHELECGCVEMHCERGCTSQEILDAIQRVHAIQRVPVTGGVFEDFLLSPRDLLCERHEESLN